jgi:hypothetical protein
LPILLYVGGLVALGSVLNAEKAFINFQFGSYFARIASSQHKVFSAVWAVLSIIAALFFSWLTYAFNSDASLNNVVKILAVFITVVAVFDFIHRFFDQKSTAILSFVGQLNDFSLNSYLTVDLWITAHRHPSWRAVSGSLSIVEYLHNVGAPYWIPRVSTTCDSRCLSLHHDYSTCI